MLPRQSTLAISEATEVRLHCPSRATSFSSPILTYSSYPQVTFGHNSLLPRATHGAQCNTRVHSHRAETPWLLTTPALPLMHKSDTPMVSRTFSSATSLARSKSEPMLSALTVITQLKLTDRETRSKCFCLNVQNQKLRCVNVRVASKAVISFVATSFQQRQQTQSFFYLLNPVVLMTQSTLPPMSSKKNFCHADMLTRTALRCCHVACGNPFPHVLDMHLGWEPVCSHNFRV